MTPWLLLTSLLDADATVVDRVVVVVGEQPVLASEIHTEVVLSQRDRSPVPFWDLVDDDPLRQLVDTLVVRASAGDIELYEPQPEQIRERVETLRLQFDDGVAWSTTLERWGLDEDGLTAWMRRRLIVERFLLRNLPVSTSERDAWRDAARALVQQLRARFRVREVSPSPSMRSPS